MLRQLISEAFHWPGEDECDLLKHSEVSGRNLRLVEQVAADVRWQMWGA
jgi:hypothetical protein